jgi:hypothetical protein
VDAVQRFDGAKKHSGALAFGFGREVDHVGGAVNELHVGVSGRAKQSAIVGAQATIGVVRRIA